ncbi:MAG: transcriptional regulator NrdR [Clostridiales bacterium]|nr:transcriptional regulator NrdR [Clostridiales bacterium]
MRCAFCGYAESRVLDSRPVEEGRSIRRRRECQQCGQRYTTYERLEEIPLVVVKSDNRRELFEPGKILNGLLKACDKRTVPMGVLEQMVGSIELELRNSLDREVSSKQIGEMVMLHLRKVDQVAYVRFASVYRNFEDVSTFIDEIRKLKKELRISTIKPRLSADDKESEKGIKDV